jgi:hypothetical protein
MSVDCSSRGNTTNTGLKESMPTYQTVKSGCLISGVVAFMSKAYPASKHDFSIFLENAGTYKEFLKKQPGEESTPDPVSRQVRWAMMADKGYVGAQTHLRAIIPKKVTAGRALSSEDRRKNKEISSARIICENFYGRMKLLFRICSDRFRGKMSL